ncbi:MAG: restriction endonuclease subunit S [Cetobacterium sp.]
MGSVKFIKKRGKVVSSRLEKLEKEFLENGGEWREKKIEELFYVGTGSLLNSKELNHGNVKRISAKSFDNGVVGTYDSRKNLRARHFKNFISVNFFGDVFYHSYEASVEMKVHTLKLKKGEFSKRTGLYIATAIKKTLRNQFSYGNQLSSSKLKGTGFKITLPFLNGDVNFSYMEKFIKELEAYHIKELEAYLSVTGLSNYQLTEKDKKIFDKFEKILNTNVLDKLKWKKFRLDEIWGKSSRGKRLKSLDREKGELPFITAGERNAGISDYISNDVDIFQKNTITIDMFGSAKYRNYNYGADDHVAIVHTEKQKKEANIFVTTCINKAANNGRFNYSRNFYAKDADELEILLPVRENVVVYNLMEEFIKVIQKLIIQELVVWTERKIETTKYVMKKK